MIDKTFQDVLLKLTESSKQLMEAMRPPTEKELSEHLKTRPSREVEGLARWGSPIGKKLARAECKRRGIKTPNLFQRIFGLW